LPERPILAEQLCLRQRYAPRKFDERRITCFATDTGGRHLPDLILRHRRRAPETAYAAPKTPAWPTCRSTTTASNAVWVAIVLLACDLRTWTQTLSLSRPLRVAEPKTLRLRLLAIAGRLTRSGRRTQLRLDRRWPWAATVAAAVARCAPSPTPANSTALAPTTRDNAPARRPAIITRRTRSLVSAENAARNLKITKDRG
jgi:Transposase DDE domain group 1